MKSVAVNKFFNDSLVVQPVTSCSIATDVQGHYKLSLFLFDANTLAVQDVKSLAKRYLSDAELNTFIQRKAIRAKREFIASRLLLKQLAKEFIQAESHHTNDIALKEIKLVFNSEQACLQFFYLDKLLPIQLSISHSNGVVLLAFNPLFTVFGISSDIASSGALGVDIEVYKAKRDLIKIAEHAFHPQDQYWVKTHGGAAFYRLWTLKESLAKATKQGVADLFNQDTLAELEHFSALSTCYQQLIEDEAKVRFDISIVSTGELLDKEIKLISAQVFKRLFTAS